MSNPSQVNNTAPVLTLYATAWDPHDPAMLAQKKRLIAYFHCSPEAITASLWMVVASESPVSANSKTRIGEVINAQLATDNTAADWWVGTRQGTLSPWGSKARDLLHRCGFEGIHRIERLIGWHLHGVDKRLLDEFLRLPPSWLLDSMTESCYVADSLPQLFAQPKRRALQHLGRDRDSLANTNITLGLALSDEEIKYLGEHYQSLGRDPTDCELMSFAQANSEHCRHKIFRAEFFIDGVRQEKSLFDWIRATHATTPAHTLMAYADNAAVIEGGLVCAFSPDATNSYGYHQATHHLVFKAETHNHPTGVSPFSGAATGSGGEIRDEAATGRGATMKAGFSGFITANINPHDLGSHPPHLASGWQIMKEAPLGSAAFNNEIGRPNLIGFFRTLDCAAQTPHLHSHRFSFHKPLMIAGGWGTIADSQVHKLPFPPATLLVQLGGPSFLIGLGGGAASSVDSGVNKSTIDFASVQRANPEMQRRCVEVINACARLGKDNPILSAHDVGAGGLSNAFTELVESMNLGGSFSLRAVPCEDPSLSPLELWSNESQERFVFAVAKDSLATLQAIAKRERCPISVVGQATTHPHIVVTDDRESATKDGINPQIAMDMPLATLIGNPPKLIRQVPALPSLVPNSSEWAQVLAASLELASIIPQVLAHPTVASKHFLITIGDRTVGGLTHRDAFVGARQMPTADCAITVSSITPVAKNAHGFVGEACAIGERPWLAVKNPQASARMAVGEMLSNLLSADIHDLSTVKLSANWMAAAGNDEQASALYHAVKACSEFCQALDLSIPVGKDSLSMQAKWRNERGEAQESLSPVTLIASAVAPLSTLTHWTPEWQCLNEDTELMLLAWNGGGRESQRMGGSILALLQGAYGEHRCPDAPAPSVIHAIVKALHLARQQGLILAYHDISDGGLITTVVEMAITSGCGFSLYLDNLCYGADPLDVDGSERNPQNLRGRYQESILRALFNEELGAILQVRANDRSAVYHLFREQGIAHLLTTIGHPARQGAEQQARVVINAQAVVDTPLKNWEMAWLSVSQAMQKDRDMPTCVDEWIEDIPHSRLISQLPKALPALLADTIAPIPPPLSLASRRTQHPPKVAILREQGINGQMELAAAFTQAGFSAVDVTLSDIEEGRINLNQFRGLGFPGGFSFGDVLGAGRGMAQSILFHPRLRPQFSTFFARPDTFALGVCNGCQVLSQLRSILMGAEHFPTLMVNRSHRYEARWVNTEVLASSSIFFQHLVGATLPIIVSHGEGRAYWPGEMPSDTHCTLRFVDSQGLPTERYPQNPNGSSGGQTGWTSRDGRITLMMPHPERAFLQQQWSWLPDNLRADHGYSPWMMMFTSARQWCNG